MRFQEHSHLEYQCIGTAFGNIESPTERTLAMCSHLFQNTHSNLAFLAFCSLDPPAVLRTNSARGRILPRPSWESFVVRASGLPTWLGRTRRFAIVLCGSVLVRLMNEQEIERKNLLTALNSLSSSSHRRRSRGDRFRSCRRGY
jgi:hypothetical protein